MELSIFIGPHAQFIDLATARRDPLYGYNIYSATDSAGDSLQMAQTACLALHISYSVACRYQQLVFKFSSQPSQEAIEYILKTCNQATIAQA
jgi:hypothetical protein